MADNPVVDFLYKYRPIDTKGHTEKIITHNQLRFSRPIDFNDPFDCRPKFSYAASETDIRIFLNEFLKKIIPIRIANQEKKILQKL